MRPDRPHAVPAAFGIRNPHAFFRVQRSPTLSKSRVPKSTIDEGEVHDVCSKEDPRHNQRSFLECCPCQSHTVVAGSARDALAHQSPVCGCAFSRLE